mmetsp:Transcript_14531/g.29381  ORF Transcript_14531/g.29381 Transcript_14531/m.29381 type:complete len:269 (+) Transcript_14531:1855-2661(+)
MARAVALGVHDGSHALLRDRQERVCPTASHAGVHSDLNVATSAVLEPDRSADARSQLTVDLAFSRTRPDGAPDNKIGNELRRDSVEEFHASVNAHFVEVKEKATSFPQSLVDTVRTVQARVIDQSLPSNGGAWFLEIDAHDDEEILLQLCGGLLQLRSVFLRRLDIMDGAWPADNEHAVVFATQNLVNGVTSGHHVVGNLLALYLFLEKAMRRDDRHNFLDAHIVYIRSGHFLVLSLLVCFHLFLGRYRFLLSIEFGLDCGQTVQNFA